RRMAKSTRRQQRVLALLCRVGHARRQHVRRSLPDKSKWNIVLTGPRRLPNVLAALMIEAAAGESYEEVLQTRVYAPLPLANTSLLSGAARPTPLLHGYSVDGSAVDDVSELFRCGVGMGFRWGGVNSSRRDPLRARLRQRPDYRAPST